MKLPQNVMGLIGMVSLVSWDIDECGLSGHIVMLKVLFEKCLRDHLDEPSPFIGISRLTGDYNACVCAG